MRNYNNILVTGGAGFIGSNFIRFMLSDKSGFKGRIINLDKLTYAGNLLNLNDIFENYEGSRYFFEHNDICDIENNIMLIKKYDIDAVVHFAAESHVDRSIHGPGTFVMTNITGTYCLAEACRTVWKDRNDVLFHHVSTDEVYGSLGDTGFFTEETRYDPRSPYSASKAGSDHLVMAYFHTYNLPVTMTNCSNNYGPYQFPEKLIPVMIYNMIDNKPLPVYGDGKNIRDWLYVEDHNSAVWSVMCKGVLGNTYNIGGDNEWENITLVKTLCSIVSNLTKRDENDLFSLIKFVQDRAGHDRRYAIDCTKLKNEIGWRQTVSFSEGLKLTAEWYIRNTKWADAIRTGEYLNWMKTNYKGRV
jgi:dTDP-glucose 4,6-dehydratase